MCDVEPFVGPRLKVSRAKRHIRDLNNEIVSYVRSNPYRVVVEQDPNSTQHLWKLRVRQEVPQEFAGIIGDAIHNMRSALDLLACDLVRLNGKDTKDVYFPFAKGVNGLEDAIKSRNIDRAGEDVLKIVRSLEPYKGGNKSLRAIHDLDVADKHVTLIPTTHYAGIKGLQITGANGGAIATISNLRVGPIKDGLNLLSLPPMNNVKLGQQFNATFTITFGQDTPLPREPVLETLEGLAQLVNNVIDSFPPLFSK